MNKEQTIEVPKEWLKHLLERVKEAEKDLKDIDIIDAQHINHLIGYCKSAEFILKK